MGSTGALTVSQSSTLCRSQIAWECCELEAAESFPYGIWGLEFDKEKRLKQKLRLKAHIPEDDRSKPLSKDSNGTTNAHIFWKRVVERYSTTQLTKPKDRLVALAGIAQTLKPRMKGQYVAGLWEEHLESQLLWHVPPVVYRNGRVTYPSKRPIYQPGDLPAPSFSWAAVYAPGGIEYGEMGYEQELRIHVVGFHGIPGKNSERFGLVDPDCYLDISCALLRIEVLSESKRNTHYTWRLLDGMKRESIRCDLDCPSDDFDYIKDPNAAVYCVPVYKNPSAELKCLLLKEEKGVGELYYRRVGYTFVPGDRSQYEDTLQSLWPDRDELTRTTVRIR
jgi:hypothetical protein